MHVGPSTGAPKGNQNANAGLVGRLRISLRMWDWVVDRQDSNLQQGRYKAGKRIRPLGARHRCSSSALSDARVESEGTFPSALTAAETDHLVPCMNACISSGGQFAIFVGIHGLENSFVSRLKFLQ